MQAPVKPYINKGRLDMKQNVPGFVWQSEEDSQKDTCVNFYDVAKPLCLETDASAVSFRAGLLQVGDGIDCGYEKVPYNTTLRPNAFARKSLLSIEWHYSNIEVRPLGYCLG